MKNFLLLGVVCFFLSMISCKKDPVDEVVADNKTIPTSGFLKIEFDNVFDTVDLVLDSNYVLANGDKFKPRIYKYYISNVKLIASDSSVYAEPESYYLIDESNSQTQTITIDGVPFKNYIGLTFMIGVDSARNVSGAQSGALDPANNMFWTWNTGYIQAKVEGVSQQSTAPGGSVAFHIGGFKGINNPLKWVTLSFNGNSASVQNGKTPEVHISCDLNEWFVNPNTLDLSTTNNVTMVNSTSKKIADNYADMFSFEHLHN